jgi:NAD(P)-dependent dehydrogenase (short-subunit alcohol dehydrogenase family)
MPTVLITGAGSGIGSLTATHLARAGHQVFASMRDPDGRNREHADAFRKLGDDESLFTRVVELDVSSEDSCREAVKDVIDEVDQLDVVLHNAGHLYLGYVEAFTPEDLQQLFDVNTIAVQRLNRAVLPHMRKRRRGTLMYTGSTIPISTPPFLGPYVVSKAAMDSLAVVTSYEVSQFGIETIIIMPGAFTQGTDHFPNASRAGDDSINADYALLDPLVGRNTEATQGLFDSPDDDDPTSVAEEITRILDLPYGKRPFRSVVDATHANVEEANEVIAKIRRDFVTRLGFGELLELRTSEAQADGSASA